MTYAADAKKFSILDHLDKLTPAKGKNRYHCPSCEGHNLTIDPKTGEYQCWNGCECKDIREAIAPWDEVKRDARNPTRRVIPAPRRSKLFSKPAPIPEGKIKLARLPGEVTHPEKQPLVWDEATDALKYIVRQEAEEEKIPLESLKHNCTITRYPYSSAQWVARIDYPHPEKPKGYWKTLRPFHRTKDGVEKIGKGNHSWNAYRFAEVLSHCAGQWGLAVEGEGCVESARSLGVVCFTFQGGSWSDKDIETAVKTFKKAKKGGIAYLPDNDDAGFKKAEKLQEVCIKIGVPFLLIKPTDLWADIPEHGDIVDWQKWGMEQGWDKEEFIRRLEQQFNAAADTAREEQSADTKEASEEWDGGIEIPDSLNPRQTFLQFTLDALYGDKPWICVNNKLYCWTGTYYEYVEDGNELNRLRKWANTYPEYDKKGKRTYPYAKPSCVREALSWIKISFWVSPKLINPSGLNCTNGVLQINWEGGEPNWKLIPHDPALYYTYEPLVKYDPDADGSACDRLLEALDQQERDIFLKTIGASLDLRSVRKLKGRTVRGLIMKGYGANGKDTLREAVSLMYGRTGLTSCTLSDFASYDNGRKFPLARLRHSRVNWASENANTTRLDKIQSLKAFITGDPLSAEAKGRDEDEFIPTGIALFNANDTPKLQGTMEAIASRYAVLSFNKTFKIGANPELGEVEADPRFKYDPDFLNHEVLPAFLNRVLDALRRLMSEGIDYSCTKKALEDIQAENSHLFQFAQDTGLGYNQTCILTAGELWVILEQWYLNNGTLTYEESSTGSSKAVWMEQANPYDRNIKGANQVLGRFQKLFPKAKRVSIPHPNGSKKNVPALKGLGFNSGGGGDGGQPTPIPPQPTPIPPQDPPQKTTENQGFHPTHPSFSHLCEKNEKTENPSTDPGNVNLKNSDDSQSLGWVGCDAQKSRVSGVDNWGGTGVENDQTGVGETAETDEGAIATACPIGRIAKRVQSERIATPAVEIHSDAIADACSLERIATPEVEIELEQWLTEESIQGIAHDLEICDSKEVLGYLRDLYPKEALKEAVKLLSPEKLEIIKSWVIELNGSFAIAPACPIGRIGTKVRLNLPGSIRHGKIGIVVKTHGQAEEQELIVKFDDYDLRKDLREMECYPDWLTTDLESPLPDKVEPQPKPPAPTRTVKPKPEPAEPAPTSYDDVISAIDIELNRLGWTAYQAQTWLNAKYGVRSRQLLSDEQLLELLETLKAMPTDTPIGKQCVIQRIGGDCYHPKLERLEGILIDQPSPPVQSFWRFLIEGQLVPIFSSDDWELI